MFTFRIGSKSRIGYRNKQHHIRQFHGSLQKLKLIQEIQKIYKSDNEVWTEKGVLPAHIKAMITHINEGYSAFHPILVYKPFQLGQDIGVNDVDAMRRHDKLGYCCLSRKVFDHDDDPYTSVCVPSLPVDSLLFKALANILMREFLWRRNNLPPLCELTHYNEILDYHESFWNDQKDIDRIICVDLSPSIKHVSTERFWSTLTCLHNLGVITNILHKFVYLPICNASTNLPIPSSNCIPLIGELSDVLLHLFLQYQFDSVVLDRYEGVLYTRWNTNVLLASRSHDSYLIEKDEIRNILNHVNLSSRNMSVLERDVGCSLPFDEEMRELILSEDGYARVMKDGEGEIERDD